MKKIFLFLGLFILLTNILISAENNLLNLKKTFSYQSKNNSKKSNNNKKINLWFQLLFLQNDDENEENENDLDFNSSNEINDDNDDEKYKSEKFNFIQYQYSNLFNINRNIVNKKYNKYLINSYTLPSPIKKNILISIFRI